MRIQEMDLYVYDAPMDGNEDAEMCSHYDI